MPARGDRGVQLQGAHRLGALPRVRRPQLRAAGRAAPALRGLPAGRPHHQGGYARMLHCKSHNINYSLGEGYSGY